MESKVGNASNTVWNNRPLLRTISHFLLAYDVISLAAVGHCASKALTVSAVWGPLLKSNFPAYSEPKGKKEEPFAAYKKEILKLTASAITSSSLQPWNNAKDILVKLLLVGDLNAGKTSLMTRFEDDCWVDGYK